MLFLAFFNVDLGGIWDRRFSLACLSRRGRKLLTSPPLLTLSTLFHLKYFKYISNTWHHTANVAIYLCITIPRLLEDALDLAPDP